MAAMPKEVWTRQIAIAAELGYGPDDVVAHSFDDTGMTVLGERHGDGRVTIASGEQVTTHVRWPTEDFATRALEAKRLDFEETFGGPLPHL